MNPGASYRGFHDSIVNYLGNAEPQMVVCLHEEHAVAIADGYAKITDRPAVSSATMVALSGSKPSRRASRYRVTINSA